MNARCMCILRCLLQHVRFSFFSVYAENEEKFTLNLLSSLFNNSGNVYFSLLSLSLSRSFFGEACFCIHSIHIFIICVCAEPVHYCFYLRLLLSHSHHNSTQKALQCLLTFVLLLLFVFIFFSFLSFFIVFANSKKKKKT